jgi:hypothetical protein
VIVIVIVHETNRSSPPRATGRHIGGNSPGSLAAVAVVALLLVDITAAEEIAPFKMTGMEAYATMTYLSDKQTSDLPDTGRVQTAQSGWRNELFVMTHSYVYHPNLLTLDIGGGPILHNEHFLDDQGGTKASGLLYNLTLRANFLRATPYPGALFYSHLNPTVSVTPGRVMTQENDRLGLDWSLLAPVAPLPLHLSFLRTRTRGRGADRIVDDRTEQLRLSGTHSYAARGSTQFQFETSRQESSSGSVDLPVQSSNASHQAFNLDTRLQLGDKRQYDLTNLISIDRQKYSVDTRPVPTSNDLRILFDGRARHSEQVRTYGTFSYGHSAQGTLDTTVLDAATGLTYWPVRDLEFGLAARAGGSRTQQFKSSARGLDASLRYERELPLGALAVSYAARFDRRDQDAAAPRVPIVGERLSLAGSDYTTLGHSHIVVGTTLVSNATRSQVFVEGIDFQLVVYGKDTRIQRLVGGRILDGEQLLVDYSYDVGGTYAFDQVDQTFSATWTVARYGSAYLRQRNSRQRLLSGVPTFSLNDITSTLVGARVDFPFKLGMALVAGANVEHENDRETIMPRRRTSSNAYLQTEEPVFDLGFLRGSVHRARVDYGDVTRNSDLRGYDLRYWWRNELDMDISAGLVREHEDAGLLPRRRRERTVSLAWKRRRFSLSANLVSADEAQGTFQRRRTSVLLQVRRDL